MIRVTIEVDEETFVAEADTQLNVQGYDTQYNVAQRKELADQVAAFWASLEKRTVYNREG